MSSPPVQSIVVGFHVHRHFGGPGRVEISTGELTLTNRKQTRSIRHAGEVVRVQRKRWEPPTGNHWIEVTDGETTAYATAGRKRAERVVVALESAGFVVERR